MGGTRVVSVTPSCLGGCNNGQYDVPKCRLELEDLISSELLRFDCRYSALTVNYLAAVLTAVCAHCRLYCLAIAKGPTPQGKLKAEIIPLLRISVMGERVVSP